MADEGKLREQAARGDRARRILEDDLVKEVLEKVEKRIFEGFRESTGDEQVVRERAYLMLRLLENFKAEFRTMLLTGSQASKELLRLKDPNKLTRMIANVRR